MEELTLMRFLLLITILSISLLSNDLKEVSLQLQWKYQFQFAGYIMAKERGYYKNIGLDVSLKEWVDGINMVDEVVNGSANYAISRPTSLIDIANGKKIIYLAAIFQSSPLILLTDKSSGITSIKDFPNKRLMSTGDLNIDSSLLSMMFSQGISIKDINIQKPSFNVKDLLDKKTDLLSAYISNEPFILKELGGEPLIFSPKDYGFDFYNDIIITSKEYLKTYPEEVKAFRRATLQGWEYAFNNIEETVEIILKKYNTLKKSKQALLYEAKELKKLAYYNTDKIGSIEYQKLEKIYDIYKLLGLIPKNVNLKNIIYNEHSIETQLTDKEKEYLQKKESITMCIDPNWMPFEKFDKQGNYIGMTADYYKLFEKSLSTKFTLLKTKTWSESLKLAQERKCDILSLVMKTPQRSEYLNFTTPYMKVPLVITTRPNISFINSIEDLDNMKVGIPKGYAYGELLKIKYPNLNIIEVEDIDEGLDRVKNAELFAYIGTLASIGYKFQTKYLGELKIAGKLDQKWELGIGVRNDDEILLNILQKAVNNISTTQEREILNKWISIKYENGVDYTLLIRTSIFFLIIITLLSYFYRKQQILKNRLKIQKDEFETIFNTSKIGIAIIDLETNFLNFNREYLHITGYGKEELLEKSYVDIAVAKDIVLLKKAIDELLEKEFLEDFETVCFGKDNKKIVMNLSMTLMPDKKSLLISARDVTESRKKSKLINDYVELVDKNIITSTTDLHGKIINVSEAFSQASGYTKEELIGKTHKIIKHPDMHKSVYQNLWDTILNNKVWRGELKNLSKDGKAYWTKVTISPIFNEDNVKIGYMGIRQNITDKKIIEELSITDALTTIYNRRYFNDIFPKLINRAKRKNELICFLILDIDYFKQYNDTYGHQKGDSALIEVAKTIKNSLRRADDYCFRLGGEEFGIIFNADTKEQSIEFANNIRRSIENLKIEHNSSSASSYLTISVGLVCKKALSIENYDSLYKSADDLLYSSKELGRNRVSHN